MMWIEVNRTFQFDRRPRQAIAFELKPGRHNAPHDVAEAAIRAGAATELEPPRRKRTNQNNETSAA